MCFKISTYAAFFFALAFCFSSTSAKESTIRLYASFPQYSKALNFTCSTQAFLLQYYIGPGHEWYVDRNRVESCNVTWGHSHASFKAFDYVDKDYPLVYWNVKFDGFFQSYDDRIYHKKASWVG
ncbi:hypothetical protein L6164_016511 [Bauhinia variegata]|uniref:Uncharacterized protein n=1 Tax=Bauhinia variegata TaxID=167791 RepID=A0ACB9NPM0_BAUVA|nr:hypothetical protein L6164_016511 [Bauhinia variegata]